MFICNHCPYVQGGRGSADPPGARRSSARGVAVRRRLLERRGELPGRRASTSCAERWRDKGYGFPYLHDEAQDVARAFGAVCTPDIFVYDRERPSSPTAGASTTRGRTRARSPGASSPRRWRRCWRRAPSPRSSGRRWGARSNGDSTKRERSVASTTRCAADAHPDPKGHWRAYLERKGLKTTQQREAIVDAFLRSSGHVALEDLLVVGAPQAPAASAWRPSTARSSCWRRRGSRRRATSARARRCTRSPRGAPTTIT